MIFFYKTKKEKIQKNNRINDINYQKFVDMLQRMQKKPLCKYQGKMKKSKHLFYIQKKNKIQ